MANAIIDEFSPDIKESEDKLKNRIRSTHSKTLAESSANCVNQVKKLKTYAKFKTEIKSESYLIP